MTLEGFNRLKLGDRVRFRGRLFRFAFSVPAGEGPIPSSQPYFVRVASDGSDARSWFGSDARTFRPEQIESEADTAVASPATTVMPAVGMPTAGMPAAEPTGSVPETRS